MNPTLKNDSKKSDATGSLHLKYDPKRPQN